jgi:hypothetical protein
LVFSAGKVHQDPFNEIELDFVFTTPNGDELCVPAFWGGGQEWRMRFSAVQAGEYRFRSVCSDPGDANLHDWRGVVNVEPYTGENPILKHGPLRVSDNRRYFEHQDGTPFFWLGDTWWLGLSGRLKWPDECQTLTADRVAKGFTVIQMTAGFYPDMYPFDPRGANEGGHAWEPGFTRINPTYFDQVDLKLSWLVHSGLVPVLAGAWGYYLPILGVEKMKKHWRYLVARYGAYPVIWCLAGRVLLTGYDSTTEEQLKERTAWQKRGWTEVARALRKSDPYRRLLTTHAMAGSHGALELEDPALLDFSMVQAGHGNMSMAVGAVNGIANIIATSTVQPVVNGEMCFEGIMGGALQDVQRFAFWSNLLLGVAGFTYGANGVWQFNQPGAPFGPSPHGMAWGDMPWQEAYRLPGGIQVGIGKRLLEKYPWWRLEPHREWVQPYAGAQGFQQPYAAGIPGELRLVYFPLPIAPWDLILPQIKHLEDGVQYEASYFNPITGLFQPIGAVQADSQGNWTVPVPAIGQDLVLVMEKR